MRGGGFGGTREKGIRVLAWISYGLAVVGGAAIVSTFIGHWISGLVGLFPSWVAVVSLTAGVVAMAVDLFVDGVPNQLAVWMGIVLPSIAAATQDKSGHKAKLAQNVTSLSDALLRQVDSGLNSWLGTSSALGLAACAVLASLLVARRVVHKGAR